MKKLIFIGAGNLASHLALACKKNGFHIYQIYSRTITSAKELGIKCDTEYTNNINDIKKDADIYIYAVKDDALLEILKSVPTKNGIHIHTAGSIPIDIFKNYFSNYGALYPFQTFSKERPVNYQNIPILIEGNTENNTQFIEEFAQKISQSVSRCSSVQRKTVHLSAVFACNFVNHMYTIAEKQLKNADIDFNIIRPLIKETAEKITELSPKDAQTGPAIRYDNNIVNLHLQELDKDPYEKELYELISKNIYRSNKKINE